MEFKIEKSITLTLRGKDSVGYLLFSTVFILTNNHHLYSGKQSVYLLHVAIIALIKNLVKWQMKQKIKSDWY